MLEESLLKTNFIGRDGFRWWIGQVAPQEVQGEQIDGGGWGNRFKVRILGYHPYSVLELPDEDLPWAIALLGVTDGSGAANRATSTRISPGDTVLGFFLDGDNAQVPVILGLFGRTSSVPSLDYRSPFVPFTGYTGNIRNDGKNIVVNEANESNTQSQKSPISVSPRDAKRLTGTGGPSSGERSAYDGIGDKVVAATGAGTGVVTKIKTEVENFVNRIQSITDDVTGAVGKAKDFVNGEIGKITAKIQKVASGLVNNLVGNLYTALQPVFKAGLDLLYKTVYKIVFAATQNPVAAHLAGVAAQKSMIVPVKKIADALPCIANSIIGGLSDIIKGVLTNVAENINNFVSCIGDQVVASLMNHIIGGITKFMQPLLGAVDKILMGFSPLNWLRSTADAILNAASSLSCEEIAPEYNSQTNEWIIGKGASDNSGVPINEILEAANSAFSIAEEIINAGQDISELAGSLGVFDFMNPSVSIPGFESSLGKCYAGPPQLGGCGGTKVKIFGGFGEGASAKAIIGAIQQVSNGGRGITGSVIGVDLVNGGGGYTFPPFIEIVDECGSGYGAVARSVIDYDTGEITDIYVVSEGEGYTPSEDEVDYVRDDVNGPVVIDPGTGYLPTDIITDSNDVKYTITVDDNGGIIGTNIADTDPQTGEVIRTTARTSSTIVSNIPFGSIDDTVTYRIDTQTGYGARLRSRLIQRPAGSQGQVKQVIDCIE